MSLARAIGRSTIATTVARFSVLLVWLLATPAILRSLGPDRFGLWSILFVVTQVLASLDFGVGTAVSRYLGELSGRGAQRELAGLVRKSVLLQAGLVVLLGLPAFLLRGPILDFFPVDPAWRPEAADAFAFTLLAFAAGALVNLLVSCLQGLTRMDLAVRIFLPASLALYLGIRWAVGEARPLRALTLVQAGYALAVLGALVPALRLAMRPAGAADPAVHPASRVAWRDLLGLGSWIQATTILGLLQNNLDKILLGRLVSLSAAGAFEIALRVVVVAFLPVTFFLTSLLPILARHFAGLGARAESRRAVYAAALGPYFAVSCAIAGLLVAVAGAVLEAWLDAPPEHATWMLRVLAVAVFLNFATGIVGTIARATDRARDETAYGAAMVALHLALALGGFALWGLRGLLAGAVVSALLAGAWMIHRIESWLGFEPLRPTVRALGGPLLAASAAATAALLLDRSLTEGEPGRARGLLRLAVLVPVYGGLFLAILALGFRRAFADMRGRLGRLLAGARDLVG